MQKTLLDFFAGSRSVARVAEARGYKTFSTDIMAFDAIDLVADVLNVRAKDFPFIPDVIWASPPCTAFSVASLGTHWTGENQPKTTEAVIAVEIVAKTILLLREFEFLNPKVKWFFENPCGKLRKLPVVAGIDRATIR